MKLWKRFLVVSLLTTAGCGRGPHAEQPVPDSFVEMLNNSDRYELFSLDPQIPTTDPAAGTYFHDYRILGSAVIIDDRNRQLLNDALLTGIRNAPQQAYACFEPRHGLRITRGGKTIDLVICFGCGHIDTYGADELTFRVSGTPYAAFDAMLRACSIPLPTR